MTLEEAIVPVPWPCAYCDHLNKTPTVLWDTVRFTLICANCGCQQDYPNYIWKFDPNPPDPARRRR